MFRIPVLIVLSVFVATGCSHMGEAATENSGSAATSYEDEYAAAQDALARAVAARNVWSKTEALLQQSQLANSEGRVTDAIALASEARIQAELALEQARSEQDAWRSRVLSD